MQQHKSRTSKYQIQMFQQIKFFQELQNEQGKDVFEQCIAKLQIETFSAGQVVMRIGDIGDRFFIILKGQVLVYIALESQEKVLINTLGSGQSFGELALLNDKPRMATIVCQQDSVFATLSKRNYKDILSSKQQIKMIQIINKFLQVSGIQNFNSKGLTMLYCSSIERHLVRRQILYQKDDQADCFYIVTEGQFRLYYTSMHQTHNICLVGENELLGEFESLHDLPYKLTAECESENATVYYVKKRKQLFYKIRFLNIISANYLYELLNQIKLQSIAKEAIRQRQSIPISKKPQLQINSEPIESTRTIYYSEKNHTYLSDNILVQANRQVINKILGRTNMVRPIIQINQPARKAKLDTNLRIKSVSVHMERLKQRKKQLNISLSQLI